MTDTAGDQPPFPGFPGFPPAEMLDKMWDMMRLTPFGAAFPGMQPGTAQGMRSPLAAMSDMMAPLTNVEELDKRITDMRAVEQWLKLNLNMLQSAIQALEVQRATLATLRAFGAFAQASMTQPADAAAHASAPPSASSSSSSSYSSSPSSWGASPSRPEEDAGGGKQGESAADAQAPGSAASGDAGAAFDPAGWWNLLQSQFNQLAAFAMTQPDGAQSADSAAKASKKAGGASKGAKGAGADASGSKPAAKRAPARKRAAKSAAGSGSGARGERGDK